MTVGRSQIMDLCIALSLNWIVMKSIDSDFFWCNMALRMGRRAHGSYSPITMITGLMLMSLIILVLYCAFRCPACPSDATQFGWAVDRLTGLPYDEMISSHRRYNMKRYKGVTFLDYATSGICVDSQINNFTHLLRENLYGNTHSESPSSERSTNVVEDLRIGILKWLGTTPLQHTVIFTHSEGHALKTFVESFPFNESSRFVISSWSSNDVIGLAATAEGKKAKVSHFDPTDALDSVIFSGDSDHLVVFPLVNAFDGSVLSDADISHLLSLNASSRGSVALLADASHHLQSGRLDLKATPFSAIAFSFEKLFGFPSIGALVVSNSLIPRLAKPYFGGGTLVYALPEQSVEKLRLRPAERFEDGSLPFLNLVAVESGFGLRRQLGEASISEHVRAMTRTVVSRMKALNNTDG
jgi:molybdenum cofactor sulfurtransferase